MRKLRQYLLKFWQDLSTRNSFLQNSAWLFSASALSTLIQFIFFPILSRIYDPAAYGVFGLFNALVANLAIIAGLNLSRAFVLLKEDRNFRALLHTAFRSVLLVSGITLIVTLIAGPQLCALFNAEELGAWIYLAAPAVFLIAFDRMLVEWAVRLKAFRKFAIFNVQSALASKLFNVFYGLKISNNASGLILTHLLNFFLRIVIYYRLVIWKERKSLWQGSSRDERKLMLKEYRTFPLYLLPGNFLNSLSNQLAVLLLPLFGLNLAAVGIYTFSLIALELPVKLLASAFGPVFLQKTAELGPERMEEIRSITWRLFRNLSLIAFVGMIILFVIGGPLYGFVFGDVWIEAGLVAEIIALSTFFRISTSPISSVLTVIRKEKHILLFQILLFSLRFAGLLIGYILELDLIGYMISYSIFNGIGYFAQGLWTFVLIKDGWWRITLFQLAGFGILITLGWFIKSLIF